MQPLMRFLFNLRHVGEPHDDGQRGIVLVIDERTGVAPDEVRRLLLVWQESLRVEAVLVRPTPLEPGELLNEMPAACRLVGVITDQKDFLASVQHECQARGAACIDSVPPGRSDVREAALYQEVSHHDFEMGGVDEWSGQPTRWAHQMLQHLSQTNCERLFPRFLLPYIQRFQGPDKRQVETLDIGCGPISVLRWGVLQGVLRVTGVDPLLDMYRMILQRHGLDGLPAIACQRALNIYAEALASVLPPESFDIVFTRNAIDHVEDPIAVISQAEACLRPGGILVLDFHTREGSRQGWEQLHQFDLYLDETNQLVCQTQQGACRPLVAAGLGLFVRQIVAKTEDVTVVILEKGEPSEALAPLPQALMTEFTPGAHWEEAPPTPWQRIAEERDLVIQEQQTWIEDLEHGKAWLEDQVPKQQARIGELEHGKAWLEDQVRKQRAWIDTLEAQVREQQAWIDELERGKAWLDAQRTIWQTRAEHWQTSFWGRLGLRLRMIHPVQETPPKEERDD